MTCALAPSSPSSRSLTTSPVTHGASPLSRPTKWATLGPCVLPSQPPRLPPPPPPPLPKVTAPMRINQTGLVQEPPPPYRPPRGMRSQMWRDTTQMTPVSDFPSCRLHHAVYHGVFQHLTCVYPFWFFQSPFLSLITASPFWPPVARHPSSRVALWLYLSPFLLSARRPSLSICNRLPNVCMCVHACCVSPCVCLCAAANSFLSVDRQPTVAAAKNTAPPPPPSPPLLLSSN